MKYKLGYWHFDTKLQIKEKMQEILAKGPRVICSEREGGAGVIEEESFIRDLLRWHPMYRDKLKQIGASSDSLNIDGVHFEVVKNKVGNDHGIEICVCLCDSMEDYNPEQDGRVDISYNKALAGKDKTPYQKRMDAYRNQIYDQILSFRANTPIPKRLEGQKCEIDHCGKSFIELVHEFESIYYSGSDMLTLLHLEFCPHPKFNSSAFDVEKSVVAREIARRWENFHKENAELQWLSEEEHKELTKKRKDTYLSKKEAQKLLVLLDKLLANVTLVDPEILNYQSEDYPDETWGNPVLIIKKLVKKHFTKE